MGHLNDTFSISGPACAILLCALITCFVVPSFMKSTGTNLKDFTVIFVNLNSKTGRYHCYALYGTLP